MPRLSLIVASAEAVSRAVLSSTATTRSRIRGLVSWFRLSTSASTFCAMFAASSVSWSKTEDPAGITSPGERIRAPREPRLSSMYLRPVMPCEAAEATLSSATGVWALSESVTTSTETSFGSTASESTRPTRMPLYFTGAPTSRPLSDWLASEKRTA